MMKEFDGKELPEPNRVEGKPIIQHNDLSRTARCIRSYTFSAYTYIGMPAYCAYNIQEAAFRVFNWSEWNITTAEFAKDLEANKCITMCPQNDIPLECDDTRLLPNKKDYEFTADMLLHTFLRIYKQILKVENNTPFHKKLQNSSREIIFLQENIKNFDLMQEKMKKLWNDNLKITKSELKEHGICLNISI